MKWSYEKRFQPHGSTETLLEAPSRQRIREAHIHRRRCGTAPLLPKTATRSRSMSPEHRHVPRARPCDALVACTIRRGARTIRGI